MRSSLSRAVPTALLAAVASLLIWPGTAVANCHVATWDSDQVRVGEADGRVELYIELDGRGTVKCTGSVKWTTVNASAVAPEDFTASRGELSWTPGSERRRTVRIPIINDTIAEGSGETFNVTMTAGPGGIEVEEVGPGEGGPTVAVFIGDDDATPSPSPTASRPVANTASRDKDGNSGVIVGLVAGALVLGALASLWLRRRGSRAR